MPHSTITDAMRAQVTSKWHESIQHLSRGSASVSGFMDFREAWAISVRFLYPQDISSVPVDAHGRAYGIGKDLNKALKAFHSVNRSKNFPALLETFLNDVGQNFYLIANDIGRFMARYEEHKSTNEIRALIFRLVEWYKAWAPPEDLGPRMFQPYALTFQTHLFSALPPSFTSGFKALCASLLSPAFEEDSTMAMDVDITEQGPIPSPRYYATPSAPPPAPPPLDMTTHASLWSAIDLLGLIERHEGMILSVGYEFVEAHVLETCEGQWERPMVEELRMWAADQVVPWLVWVYGRGAQNAEEAKMMLYGVGSGFDYHINKTLCDLRTREIFDIIVDYPDSMGALEDLKDCMQRMDGRAALVQSLRKLNQKRLLHPGADTTLILQQYISTIKSLRVIDPPGVLLFNVADPIRRYLRERPDTIRTIVANLVGSNNNDDDDGDSDLLALVDEDDGDAPTLIQLAHERDVDDYLNLDWDPEPVDASPEFRTNKPSDVLSTLVSIYDSPDLFVNELQTLLAQRLLTITQRGSGNVISDPVEKERRKIEMLKLRFGEAALQVCEVMLRDMTDSRRIDGLVHAQNGSTLHPSIISRQFWPALESSGLVMPGQFRRMQEDYSREYANLKPDKKLQWLPHLGTVQIELELEDRKVEVEVPPLEAAIIELFSDKPMWTLDDLVGSGAVGSIDRNAALRALSTWVDHGVLREDPENVFVLLERAEVGQGPEREREAIARPAPAADVPSLSAAQLQQAEQMRVYWKFIEGMLTNLGSLRLDRIQSMLKFAPGYDKTTEQLAAFLEAARREGHLNVRDGMWKLNKSAES